MKFRTILIDPPWEQPLMNQRKRRRGTPGNLPYPTMSLQEIKDMQIGDMAEVGCHLWLWTTNAFLRDGFDVMAAWGFKYLTDSMFCWCAPRAERQDKGSFVVIHKSLPEIIAAVLRAAEPLVAAETRPLRLGCGRRTASGYR